MRHFLDGLRHETVRHSRPILETMSSVRGLSSSRWMSYSICIGSPTAALNSPSKALRRSLICLAKPASSCAAAACWKSCAGRRPLAWTRMKKRCVAGSPYCAESRMLRPRSARKPVTLCTMPGWSGHEMRRMTELADWLLLEILLMLAFFLGAAGAGALGGARRGARESRSARDRRPLVWICC